MDQYLPHLEWIEKERRSRAQQLQTWANIHSGTDNLAGLAVMLKELTQALSVLNADIEEITLPNQAKLDRDGALKDTPLGKALSVSKHSEAPVQILLVGHMDIAYPSKLSLSNCRRTSRDILTGRGTADMKSGLIVALMALQALEMSPFAGKVGWHFLITPDEEIGSPGSTGILLKEAKSHHLGLIFEPALSDGSLVSTRKGSANFTVVVKGKAAHAGREFFKGLNALTAAARFALAAESLSDLTEETTVNVGYLQGGGPVNIVPDHAICRLNIRTKTKEDLAKMIGKIEHIVEIENTRGGATLKLHKDSERPPKIFDKKTKQIFEALKRCAHPLGIKIGWKAAGGVCDGNTLAEGGLSTIDTMGAIGGNLHTEEEYVSLSSMIQKAKLTARFLMAIAAGEVTIKT